MSSVERRSCGKCEKFDRSYIDGEPVGTIKNPVAVTGETEFYNVQLGLCRAPLGLSLGTRADIAYCAHSEFQDRPVSRAEVQPEGVPV